jgi:hypothetical protein
MMKIKTKTEDRQNAGVKVTTKSRSPEIKKHSKLNKKCSQDSYLDELSCDQLECGGMLAIE